MWQALYEDTSGQGLTVLAIALDQPDAARPWIEAAAPTYPCLIDRDHRVAELYNFVNVPQAVWIDEEGRIVRPPEIAGWFDVLRVRDRTTNTISAEVIEQRARVRARYMDAVRDWAMHGAASPNVLDASTVQSRLELPDASIAQAHAHFRLGQALLREGRADEAAQHWAEASRLHPYSWAMWRQNAQKRPNGIAASDEFFARVDALADRPYYREADLAGDR